MTLDEQITLYAIGALDEREAAELERQLAADPALRARLGEERATAAALMLTVDPVALSPRVKQRLMQRVEDELAQATRMSARQPVRQPVHAEAERRPEKPRISLGDALRWLFGGLSLAAAAAAVILGVGLLHMQGTVAQLQSQVAQLQANAQQVQQAFEAANARAAQLEQDLAAARSQLAQAQADAQQARGEADQTNATLAEVRAAAERAQAELARVQAELGVLSQAGVRSATLPENNPQFEGGAVTVFFSPNSKSALITAANLPALSPDQDYQVWLIKDGVALPSSVFDTTAAGDGRLIVTSNEPFAAYQSVGITVEPAGGRPTPNPDGPIFLGSLS